MSRLDIYRDREKMGTMKIGHGSLHWRPANKHSFTVIDWDKFAHFMNSQ